MESFGHLQKVFLKSEFSSENTYNIATNTGGKKIPTKNEQAEKLPLLQELD